MLDLGQWCRLSATIAARQVWKSNFCQIIISLDILFGQFFQKWFLIMKKSSSKTLILHEMSSKIQVSLSNTAFLSNISKLCLKTSRVWYNKVRKAAASNCLMTSLSALQIKILCIGLYLYTGIKTKTKAFSTQKVHLQRQTVWWNSANAKVKDLLQTRNYSNYHQ